MFSNEPKTKCTIEFSFLLALGLFLAGCGSPTDPADTRTIKANPSFSTDILEIFSRRGCTASNCHGNGAGELTLTSSPATSYGNLVGVTSPTSGEVRVIVNDAANSYLVKKLEGTQGFGNGLSMPLSASQLDNIDLTNIKNWINTGAINN